MVVFAIFQCALQVAPNRECLEKTMCLERCQAIDGWIRLELAPDGSFWRSNITIRPIRVKLHGKVVLNKNNGLFQQWYTFVINWLKLQFEFWWFFNELSEGNSGVWLISLRQNVVISHLVLSCPKKSAARVTVANLTPPPSLQTTQTPKLSRSCHNENRMDWSPSLGLPTHEILAPQQIVGQRYEFGKLH